MQGGALSPVLFSMYISDFENELINSFCESLYLYDISLFHLMNAALLSQAAEGLQKMLLYMFYLYATKWNSAVNTDTTKIVVFRNRGNNVKKAAQM